MKRTVKLAEFKCRSNSSFSYTDWKSAPIDCTDCYVLRTPAILPDICISRSLRFTFMFISGRVPRSFSHHCASKGEKRPLDNAIAYKESSQIIYKTFFRKMLTKRLRSGNFNTDKILALKLNEC